MLFEVPMTGKNGKNASIDRESRRRQTKQELEVELQTQMNAHKYEETKASSGSGIIEGEGTEAYELSEKVGFLGAWNAELAEVVDGIPDISKGRAGNARYETETGLLVEWDRDGTRPVLVERSGSGESVRTKEIYDLLEIAKRFTLTELEAAYDGAKAKLEHLKLAEEREKGGPRQPLSES